MGKYDENIVRLTELLNQSMKIRKDLREELSSLFEVLEDDFKGESKSSISLLAKAIRDERVNLGIVDIKKNEKVTSSEIEDYLWGWLGITSAQVINMDEEALIRFIYILNLMNKGELL